MKNNNKKMNRWNNKLFNNKNNKLFKTKKSRKEMDKMFSTTVFIIIK